MTWDLRTGNNGARPPGTIKYSQDNPLQVVTMVGCRSC